MSKDYTYTVEFTEAQMRLVTAFIGNISGGEHLKLYPLYCDMIEALDVRSVSFDDQVEVVKSGFTYTTFKAKSL